MRITDKRKVPCREMEGSRAHCQKNKLFFCSGKTPHNTSLTIVRDHVSSERKTNTHHLICRYFPNAFKGLNGGPAFAAVQRYQGIVCPHIPVLATCIMSSNTVGEAGSAWALQPLPVQVNEGLESEQSLGLPLSPMHPVTWQC